jgi:chromosome segregation ATPase
MEAEEKTGRQEHLSKTVRLILDKCRTIAGEGRLVNMSVLKIVCPNHSNRDYVRALDVFKDECRDLEETKVQIPQNVLNEFNGIIRRIWNRMVDEGEKRITILKNEQITALREARADRDNTMEENENLQLQLQNAGKKMLECTDKLNRTEMAIADKDHLIERLKGELTALKAKYDCLDQNYKRLTEWREKTEQK